MLEASNYIRVIPGGCAEVCYSGTESIQDSISELLQFRQVSMQAIYQFVRMAEPQFIQQAIQHITWEDFVDLEALCDEMNACMADAILYSSKMFPFHVELMKATHNPLVFVFWNCMGEFWSRENLIRHQENIRIQDLQELQECHRRLIQAVKAGDMAPGPGLWYNPAGITGNSLLRKRGNFKWSALTTILSRLNPLYMSSRRKRPWLFTSRSGTKFSPGN